MTTTMQAPTTEELIHPTGARIRIRVTHLSVHAVQGNQYMISVDKLDPRGHWQPVSGMSTTVQGDVARDEMLGKMRAMCRPVA